MKTQDVNFGKLAADLRRAAEALDKLTGAPRIPVDDLILGALEALGPLSAYRLVKVVRRARPSLYAGLRRLEAAGRIWRARDGWTLTDPSRPGEGIPRDDASATNPAPRADERAVERGGAGAVPPVDPQIESGSREG